MAGRHGTRAPCLEVHGRGSGNSRVAKHVRGPEWYTRSYPLRWSIQEACAACTRQFQRHTQALNQAHHTVSETSSRRLMVCSECGTVTTCCTKSLHLQAGTSMGHDL